jgi:hypothetical protein
MRHYAAVVVVPDENGGRLLQAYGGKVTIALTRDHRGDARGSCMRRSPRDEVIGDPTQPARRGGRRAFGVKLPSPCLKGRTFYRYDSAVAAGLAAGCDGRRRSGPLRTRRWRGRGGGAASGQNASA